MARNDWYVGDSSRVGLTVNAAGSTASWGGTAQTMRYFKPIGGAMSLNYGFEQIPLETMSTDSETVSTGGRRVSGSFALPLSYVYNEGLFRLSLSGLNTVTGASAPYTHTVAMADPVLYGSGEYHWRDYKGSQRKATFTNFVVTQMTLSMDAQNRPIVTVNWMAQKVVFAAGANPSLVTLEYPNWDDCTVTVGAATLINQAFSLDIATPIGEGDFGIGSADSPDVTFLGRSGQRAITLTLTAGQDDALETFVQAGAALTTNTIVFDNGEAGAANRKLTVTLGSLYPQVIDAPKAVFGKLTASYTFINQGAVTIATVNALDVAEPPAPA